MKTVVFTTRVDFYVSATQLRKRNFKSLFHKEIIQGTKKFSEKCTNNNSAVQ